MRYFIVEVNPAYQSAPVIINWHGKFDVRMINPKEHHKTMIVQNGSTTAYPLVIMNSFLICNFGGMIEPVKSGQVLSGGVTPVKYTFGDLLGGMVDDAWKEFAQISKGENMFHKFKLLMMIIVGFIIVGNIVNYIFNYSDIEKQNQYLIAEFDKIQHPEGTEEIKKDFWEKDLESIFQRNIGTQ